MPGPETGTAVVRSPAACLRLTERSARLSDAAHA
jgi:hypothetical protein